MNVTLADQVECLARELRRRRKVFPVLVEAGRMAADEAAAELARMDAARQTLAQLLGLVGGVRAGERPTQSAEEAASARARSYVEPWNRLADLAKR
jgi:hypothetical protein